MAEKLGVSDPALPCKSRVPRNLEIGTSESFFHDSVEDLYRQVYYEAIVVITSAITSRFDQPGYRMYCHLQSLLLNPSSPTLFKFVLLKGQISKIFSKTPRMNEAPFESLSSGESFDRWTVSIESSLHALAVSKYNDV